MVIHNTNDASNTIKYEFLQKITQSGTNRYNRRSKIVFRSKFIRNLSKIQSNKHNHSTGRPEKDRVRAVEERDRRRKRRVSMASYG